MYRSYCVSLLILFSLSASSQIRIVSVPNDGSKLIHKESDPSLSDYLSFTIKWEIKNSRVKLPINLPPKTEHIKFMPGSRFFISEPQKNGREKKIGSGTWSPIPNGYKASYFDTNGKEQKLFLDINHQHAYYTIIDSNAEKSFIDGNTNKSIPVIDLQFYRQTPYGYYWSDLYIKQDGLEVPILSLPKAESSKILNDPKQKLQIYQRNMPINLTPEYTISDNNNNKHRSFEMCLFGVREQHKIGYGFDHYDLSSIINKFKEQGKTSEIVLNTIISPEVGFTKASSSFLSSKIDSIKISLDSRTSKCKRFVITAKIDTVSMKAQGNQVNFTGNISLYIVDIVTKKVFCRYTLCNISGVGTNPDLAIDKSLSVLNEKHSEISLFIKRGIRNIIVHYKNLLSKPLYEIISPFIPLRNMETDSNFDAPEKCFDDAIEFLLSTPKDHECYSQSLQYAAYLAYVKSEYHYRSILMQASKLVGWSNNQTKTKQNNNKALSLLKEIPKESNFYTEASYYKNEARRNLMSEKEENDEVAKMGEKAFDNMLNKNERVKMVHVQSNTASGIFTLGVLMLAAAVAAPAAAPVTAILIIL